MSKKYIEIKCPVHGDVMHYRDVVQDMPTYHILHRQPVRARLVCPNGCTIELGVDMISMIQKKGE